MYNLTKNEKTLCNEVFNAILKSEVLGRGRELDLLKFYGSGIALKMGIAEEFLSENFETVSEALEFYSTCEEMVENIKSSK